MVDASWNALHKGLVCCHSFRTVTDGILLHEGNLECEEAHSGGAKPRERAAYSLNAACRFHWALNLRINRTRVAHARLTEESELPSLMLHVPCWQA